MGVYIKGMEMPTSCWEDDCPCLNKQYGFCQADDDKGFVYSNKPEWCPLASVPEHGDLIDRKAICLTDFEIAMCDGDYKEGMKMLLEKIESAPTIIPEEGE